MIRAAGNIDGCVLRNGRVTIAQVVQAGLILPVGRCTSRYLIGARTQRFSVYRNLPNT